MIKEDFNLAAFEAEYNWSNLLEELEAVDLFENVTHQAIKQILETGKLLKLQSNEYLIKQGDTDNELYILLYGHLLISKNDGQVENYLAEISPINSVGEMAFFTNNPRMASVVAVRDCILVQLHQSKILANPKFLAFITNIAKVATFRLSKQMIIESFYKRKVKVISLIPAGDFNDIKAFAEHFYKALSIYGKVKFKTQQHDEEEMHVRYYHQEEDDNDYILNIVSKDVNNFTINCINQSDHLIFVTKEHVNCSLNPLEKYIFNEKKYLHKKELVFIRNHIDETSEELRQCLKNRNVNGYFNILNTEAEYQRLIRMIIGKSYCLVLSGGSAKGLAHLGTIKALLEKKIPIDMIGGSSMGSLVAAAYARFRSYDQVIEAARILCQLKHRSYTIPFVSIYTGKETTNSTKKVCGDGTYIENLLLRFFCVATNLSDLKLEISQSGLLWEAVRKSISIPAILPPIVNDTGQIIIDGCILNNLPVDIMRRMCNGSKIIASQIIQTNIDHRFDPCNGIMNGVSILLRKLNPFSRRMNIPKLNVVFAKSLLISSQEHQYRMARDADYCIDHAVPNIGLFDFQKLDQIINIGYENTLKQLEQTDLATTLK